MVLGEKTSAKCKSVICQCKTNAMMQEICCGWLPGCCYTVVLGHCERVARVFWVAAKLIFTSPKSKVPRMKFLVNEDRNEVPGC